VLVTRAPEEAAPLTDALARTGAPIRLQAVERPDLAFLFERRHVLVRPDGHVAWRGDAMPDNPREVADVVRGA
jgi:hypothetical protein